ncbi:hypothetical protein TNCV_2049361 [Trichonephila clavipes]|nr:hypothetical protein TNCV_2049361 [Trichonephila clavipes]
MRSAQYLVCVPSARQSVITNYLQVRTSAYADSTPIPSRQLFCIVTFHERMRGLHFSAPVPPIQGAAPGVTLRAEIGTRL